MTNNLLATFMVIVYIGLNIFLGFHNRKQAQSAASFSVASRQLSVVPLAMLVLTGVVSGGSTVGVVQGSYIYGMSGANYLFGGALGLILCTFTIVPIYRVLGYKRNCMTAGGVYSVLYDRKTGTLVSIFDVLGLCAVLAATPIAAAGVLSPMLGLSKLACVLLFTVLSIVLIAAGGIKGAASMSKVHGFVMIAGAVVVCLVAVNKAGGMAVIQASVPDYNFSIMYPSTSAAMGVLFSSCIIKTTSSFVSPVSFAGKTEKDACRGLILAGVLLCVLAVCMSFIGLAGQIIEPGITNTTSAIYVIADSCGSIWGGIMSMAVLASILSSVVPGYITVGVNVCQNLYMLKNTKADDKKQIAISRLAAIVLCIVCTVCAYGLEVIVRFLEIAMQISSCEAFVFLTAMAWKKTTANTFFYSMLIGGCMSLVWALLGSPLGVGPAFIGYGVSFVVIVVCNLFTKEKISKGWIEYARLKKEYEEECAAGTLEA